MESAFLFKMSVMLTNVDKLQPADETDLNFFFKLQCEKCDETTKTNQVACIGIKDHVNDVGNWCNFTFKCKECDNEGWVDLVGCGDTQINTSLMLHPLVKIWCKGFIPIHPSVNGGFLASKGDVTIDVDLSKGSWAGEDSDLQGHYGVTVVEVTCEKTVERRMIKKRKKKFNRKR